MDARLELIVRTTRVVVDLDALVERATVLAASDAGAREDAEILRASATFVRAQLMDGLYGVKPHAGAPPIGNRIPVPD